MNSDIGLAIELRSVSKEYPGVTALQGIDLRVNKGSIHGFLGPNGAGKSTAMNIIAGLIPPSSGEVFVMGENALTNPKLAIKQIGILPEHPPLYLNMRVRDYLEFSQNIHGNRNKKLLDSIIERTDLGNVSHRLIANLSKGYRQRVGMAQALVYEASVIILDEPMVGLDPNAIASVRELIIELKQDHTILLSTHQLYEAAKVCDDITIIKKGQIIKTGTIETLATDLEGSKKFEAVVNAASFSKDKIADISGVEEVIVNNDQVTIIVNHTTDIRADLTKALVAHTDLYSFAQHQNDLEDIFKQVVRND